jgi:hypothetical protein
MKWSVRDSSVGIKQLRVIYVSILSALLSKLSADQGCTESNLDYGFIFGFGESISMNESLAFIIINY